MQLLSFFFTTFALLNQSSVEEFNQNSLLDARILFSKCVVEEGIEDTLNSLFPFEYPPFQVELNEIQTYHAFFEIRYRILPAIIPCTRHGSKNETRELKYDTMNMDLSLYIVSTLRIPNIDPRDYVLYHFFLKQSSADPEHKLQIDWTKRMTYWIELKKSQQVYHYYKEYYDCCMSPRSVEERFEEWLLNVKTFPSRADEWIAQTLHYTFYVLSMWCELLYRVLVSLF